MSSTLLTELRSLLIANGIGRDPRVVGALPPVWRQPRQGIPAPGEGSGVEVGASSVIALFLSGGFPSNPFEGFMGRPTVDVRIRSLKAPDAEAIGLSIKRLLDDKRYYMMGNLRVHESLLSRPLSLIVSDDQGFDYIMAFAFTTRDAEVAALP